MRSVLLDTVGFTTTSNCSMLPVGNTKTRVCPYPWVIWAGRKAHRVNHRTRLAVLGLLVGALAFGAGCTGILSEDDVTRDVIVVNQDSTNHAVVVEISDDSGLVYSDERTLDAESDLKMVQFNQTGEYEVAVTVDGDTTTTTRHTFESKDRPIQAINIGIDNQGTVTVE
ncbi:hypothetical protein [Halorubrum sp. N11]|uniref:hypothetical protein n=1 Tax=Halorubrum sp. N11 TaxID=3402276 RepID=UPI003EBC7699